MLVITQDLIDAIVAHARRDHPDEACGVVAGPGGHRPARAVHPDAERRALADLLRVRLGRPAAALPRDGRPRRGAGRRLPLAHGDRGLPLADRHLLRLRAGGALRAGLDPRAPESTAPRVPVATGSSTAWSPRKPVGSSRRCTCEPAGASAHGRATCSHRRSRPHGHRGPDPDDPAHATPAARSPSRATGGTLDDAVRRPRRRHPAWRPAGGRRQLRRFVNVYLNDEDVRFLGGIGTPLQGRRSGTAATSSAPSRPAGWRTSIVVHARAEEWPDGIGAHDLVTARALAALPVLLRVRRAAAGRGRRARRLEGRRRRRRRRAAGAPRRRARASSRARSSPSQPYPGRRAPARCTSSARSRPRRRASRAGPGWRSNARSALKPAVEGLQRCASRRPFGAANPPRPAASVGAAWAPSTPSRTRRAGSARPPPPSTSPPASPRPATRRSWSTSIRRATPPSASACRATSGPGLYDVLERRRRRRPTPSAPTDDRAPVAARLHARPRGRDDGAAAAAGLRAPPARRARARCATSYAFMLLDCPPSLGPLTVNALVAADRVIVPVQTEYFALEGLAGLLDTLVADPARAQPAADGRGHAADDARRAHQARRRTSSARCAQHFPALVFDTVIPRNVRLGEAPSFGRPGHPSRPALRRLGGLLRAGQGGGRPWLSARAAWAAAWRRSCSRPPSSAAASAMPRAAPAPGRADHAEPAPAAAPVRRGRAARAGRLAARARRPAAGARAPASPAAPTS